MLKQLNSLRQPTCKICSTFFPQAANEEALKRKNGLADNLEAWKNFEEKRMDGPLKLDLV